MLVSGSTMDDMFLVVLLLLLKRSCNTFLLYVLKNVAQYYTEYEILEKLLNLKKFSLNILNIAVLSVHSNSKGRFCKSCPVNFEFTR